jgi:hypothetical protein
LRRILNIHIKPAAMIDDPVCIGICTIENGACIGCGRRVAAENDEDDDDVLIGDDGPIKAPPR